VNIRHLEEGDYDAIIAVLDDWWGGRQMSYLLPRIFFVHFRETSFAIEEDSKVVAFLAGFVSQTYADEAYIYFVGVHPDYRGSLYYFTRERWVHRVSHAHGFPNGGRHWGTSGRALHAQLRTERTTPSAIREKTFLVFRGEECP
jgi:hypothetical protein